MITNIEYEKATIEDVVNEANEIWEKVKKFNIKNVEDGERRIEQIRAEHEAFCKHYLIVVRYMCTYNSYSSKALRYFLKKIAEKPWKSVDEFLEHQANYTVLLYRFTHKNANKTELANIRKNTLQILRDERKLFEKMVEEYDRECAEEEKRYKRRNISRLKKYIANNPDLAERYVGRFWTKTKYDVDREMELERQDEERISRMIDEEPAPNCLEAL